MVDTVNTSAQTAAERVDAAKGRSELSLRNKSAVEAAALSPEDKLKLRKLTEATEQFEAIFVRQLLKTAKFGGKAAEKGHGTMIVDAMSKSVTANGGLGFARVIRDNLAESYLRNSGVTASREAIAAAIDDD